jgi:chemotaxis protein MotB
MRRFTGVILMGLVLSGCVAKKQYLALESDKNECDLELVKRDAAMANARAEIEVLEEERKKLLGDRARLGESVAELELAVAELESRRKSAEVRVAAFQDMLARFQKLIDAGTLRVKIVDGRMVVELATDVLFSSGSASLSEAGKAAIEEVSGVLAEIPERAYQVEGHTDNVPIANAQYPSNWELASARALTVVRTMVDAGLDPTRVSAASFGDNKPVADNETDEGRSANRRIEIVVLPDLSGLPGFEELEAIAKDG